MVVLSETQEDHAKKSFTADKQAKTLRRLKERYGMPINDSERPRVAVSIHACKAYIATLLNGPDKADDVLRQFRIAAMAGDLVDEPNVIHAVASKAGIDSTELDTWLRQEAVEKRLHEDMQAARAPALPARAMEHKLSVLPEGGYRYSTPSYQFYKDTKLKFEVPGFWPQPFYDVAIANITPELKRKKDPNNVKEVLEWAGEPLATAEIAAVTGKAIEEVRLSLKKFATFAPMGQDGFWSLH